VAVVVIVLSDSSGSSSSSSSSRPWRMIDDRIPWVGVTCLLHSGSDGLTAQLIQTSQWKVFGLKEALLGYLSCQYPRG